MKHVSNNTDGAPEQAWFLVVDDDPALQRLITRTIESNANWHVNAFAGADAALAEAAAHPGRYDVIITDLQMPGHNGFELLDRLDKLDPEIVRLVTTGYATADNAVMSIHHHVFDILPKPFSAGQLLRVAQRALEKRRLMRHEHSSRVELEQTSELRAQQLARTVDELHAAQKLMIEKLADMVDMREHETGLHSRRVAMICEFVACRIGLPADEIELLHFGALLHDIGKIAVPDAILLKQGSLTDEERMIMQKHVEYSAQLLDNIPFLGKTLPLVKYHHERYDGHGYPSGLASRDIPLGARIFAVVDSYDAMRSNRCYRDAMSMEAAVAELQRETGAQFDPDIVKTFLECLPEVETILRDQEYFHYDLS